MDILLENKLQAIDKDIKLVKARIQRIEKLLVKNEISQNGTKDKNKPNLKMILSPGSLVIDYQTNSLLILIFLS